MSFLSAIMYSTLFTTLTVVCDNRTFDIEPSADVPRLNISTGLSILHSSGENLTDLSTGDYPGRHKNDGLLFNPNDTSNTRTTNKTTNTRPQVSDYFSDTDDMDYEGFLMFWDISVCPKSSKCLSTNNSFVPKITSPFNCDGCLCSNCDTYGDCCLDKMLNQSTFQNPLLNYTSCLSTKSVERGGFSVEKGGSSYVFITKCPLSYTVDSVRESCENLKSLLYTTSNNPPVYSHKLQMNYVNIHCAECHDDTDHLTSWTSEVSCGHAIDISQIKTFEDISRLKDLTNCQESIGPPAGALVRKCNVHDSLTILNSCNTTGRWENYDEDIERACLLYANPVSIRNQKYRNIFCVLCNEKRDDIEEFWSPSDSEYKGPLLPVSPSLSIIFNLRPRGSNIDKAPRCREDMIQDNLLNCRELICSPGRIASQNTCIDIFKTAKSLGYIMELYLHPISESRCEQLGDIHTVLSQFVKALHDMYSTEVTYLNLQFLRLNPKVCYNNATGCFQVKIKMQTVVGADISQRQAEKGLLSSWWSLMDVTLSNISWAIIDSSNVKVLENGSGTTCTPLDPITLVRGKSQHMYGIFIQLSPFSHCDKIRLKPEEYWINATTGSLETTVTDMTYKKGEYLREADHVQICVNFSNAEKPTETGGEFDTIMKLLTAISMSVSICFLFITIIICLLSNLRHTLPAKITTILVITLIIAQVLFLTSGYASGNMWACRLVGLALHYIWLSVFALKHVAGYHMYVSFVHPFKRGTSHSKTLVKYMLYSFGLPLVIVTCYTATHLILSNKTQIGYGETGCFISNQLSLGVAFVAPVSVVLISNAVFLTRVVFVIRKMSEFKKHSNHSNTKHSVIFIKMSIVLGLTWIVGCLANLIDRHTVWYLFVVLNGGIGVFVFLGQVWNNRFLKPVRRFMEVSSKIYSTTETSTSQPKSTSQS